jgi:hypothetical protein
MSLAKKLIIFDSRVSSSFHTIHLSLLICLGVFFLIHLLMHNKITKIPLE